MHGSCGLRPGYSVLPDGSVRFVLHRPDARRVQVAGDFTGWADHPLLMRREDGAWVTVTQALAREVHFYKYIVDDHWMADPSHPMGEPDGFGGRNSAFGIDPPGFSLPEGWRFASLDLHTYQEPEPLLKLEQVAYGLAALDVQAVALQEVGEHVSDSARPNAGEVIRGHLQRLTGRPWSHAWRMAHQGFQVYREGLSLLAPVPLQDVREYRLSEGLLARNAVAATVGLPGYPVRLVSAHLSWPDRGGEEEVRRLLQALSGPPAAAVRATLIAGDWNAADSEVSVRRVREAGYRDVAREVGADCPTVAKGRIDYQFLGVTPGQAPLGIRGCLPLFNRNTIRGVYYPRVSDHLGLLGIYEPAPSAGTGTGSAWAGE